MMRFSLLKIIFFFKVLIVLLLILISVAFFTFLERKILGYGHLRFGPNKVFFLGAFQPFGDAIKLFSKEDLKLKDVNMVIYILFPIIFIFIRVFIWTFVSF